MFADASFRNSSAHFFKPAWCSNFSKLSNSLVNMYISTSNFLKQLCEGVFSPLKLFWTLIILEL